MKKRVPPTFVSRSTSVLPKGPGLISLTTAVPASVPSDLNSSVPTPRPAATKNRVPLTSVKFRGLELPVPGMRSRTTAVPAGVPSDRHSSLPRNGSVAVKYRVAPDRVRFAGAVNVVGPPGATRTGVASGASRRHRLPPRKYADPPSSAYRPCGFPRPGPGR